jgi:ketopantoate hydroxymethyltransferase
LFEKNKKIVALSYFNSVLSSFLLKRDISFFRCDLREVANLQGKMKISSLNIEDIESITSYYNGDIPLVVDVPQMAFLSKNEISLEKLFIFADKTNADYLAIDLNYFDFDIVKKGSLLGLKFVGYSTNNDVSPDFIKEKVIEFQSAGGKLLILENYADAFVQMLHGTVNIPVISEKGKNCDGNYIRMDKMLGLTENEESDVNLKKIILDVVDEKIFKIKNE